MKYARNLGLDMTMTILLYSSLFTGVENETESKASIKKQKK